jgi:peroxiredoxin family protein
LLDDSRTLPAAICFYTDGVKLVCDGSPILNELRALEAGGVHLVVCQTCLDYFGLADRVRVGVVGGMTDIITAMWEADSVITL